MVLECLRSLWFRADGASVFRDDTALIGRAAFILQGVETVGSTVFSGIRLPPRLLQRISFELALPTVSSKMMHAKMHWISSRKIIRKNSPRPFLRITMKTVAYLRVSTGGQDLATQKLAILDYARRHRFTVAQFVEARLASRREKQREQIFQTIEALPAGVRLVVSELFRLGRSLGQIIQVVDQLLKKGISLVPSRSRSAWNESRIFKPR